MKKHRSPVESCVWYFLTVSLIYVILIMTIWTFFPGDPGYSDGNSVVFVGQDDIKPGGKLNYEVNVHNHTDATALISRQLINCDTGKIYALDGSTGGLKKGDHVVIVTIDIPSIAPPGRYKVANTIDYRMNPMRSIPVTYETPCFEIR